MKRKTQLLLKSGVQLCQNLGKKLAESYEYDAKSLSVFLSEKGVVTYFGRGQHEQTHNHIRTKAFNYYFLSMIDWGEINKVLNEIYVKEEVLRREGVEQTQKFNLEEIKSFHQKIWFDLSKQSNAIEGVFADYEMTAIEFEKRLGEMIHITSPATRIFDFNRYFIELRQIEEKIQADGVSKVVRGRKKEHKISNELIRHYIAFKYAYKCAKMFAMTTGLKKDTVIEKILQSEQQFREIFHTTDVEGLYAKIVLTPRNVIELTNNFISLLTGKDFVGYRNEQAYVTLYGDRDFAGWTPVSEMRVASQMQSWADWVVNEKALHPIEKAAIAQAEFLRIHPFADGNGRTSRIIANFILMANDLPTIQVRGYDGEYISADGEYVEPERFNFDVDAWNEKNLKISKSQPISYFNALNVAIRDHDANPLIYIFRQGIMESSQCVSETLDKIAEEAKVYSVGGIGVEKTKKEITK